jgi:hypothetical protein
MQPLGAGTSLEKEVVWPYAGGDALPKPLALQTRDGDEGRRRGTYDISKASKKKRLPQPLFFPCDK